MIQRNNDLATQALKSIENEGFNQPSRKRAMMSYPSSGNNLCTGSPGMQRSSSLKRSRSTLSRTFDMGDFLKASEQIEETIAFPAIEWPSFDDDDSSSCDGENSYSIASTLTRPDEERDENDDDEDEEDFIQNRRKRQCRGLIRCGRSCNLSSLWDIANRSERLGSSGSLS